MVQGCPGVVGGGSGSRLESDLKKEVVIRHHLFDYHIGCDHVCLIYVSCWVCLLHEFRLRRDLRVNGILVPDFVSRSCQSCHCDGGHLAIYDWRFFVVVLFRIFRGRICRIGRFHICRFRIYRFRIYRFRIYRFRIYRFLIYRFLIYCCRIYRFGHARIVRSRISCRRNCRIGHFRIARSAVRLRSCRNWNWRIGCRKCRTNGDSFWCDQEEIEDLRNLRDYSRNKTRKRSDGEGEEEEERNSVSCGCGCEREEEYNHL
jgi:hypothetical protein